MSKAIDAAAKWSDTKARGAKLKHGTKVNAKPKSEVSLSQPRWDQGAAGQANRLGLVTEERGDVDADTGKTINPNGVRGVRRVNMLEVYFKRGVISRRGYTAGEALRAAWDATMQGKGSDISDVRVDRTPKADAAIDIRIDRLSRLLLISKHVPTCDIGIVFAVVCEGRAIGHLPMYRHRRHDAGKRHLFAALERLAAAMGG